MNSLRALITVGPCIAEQLMWCLNSLRALITVGPCRAVDVVVE